MTKKERGELEVLFRILKREKERYVTGKELCLELDIKSCQVRKRVNKLRQLKVPVCSNGKGYKLSKDRNEVDHTINQLESRIRSMVLAINGLKSFRLKEHGRG